MTNHDFEAVLNKFNTINLRESCRQEIKAYPHDWEAVIAALKIAHAVMQEPTVEMITMGGTIRRDQDFNNHKDTSVIYKAMRDQMLKGIE